MGGLLDLVEVHRSAYPSAEHAGGRNSASSRLEFLSHCADSGQEVLVVTRQEKILANFGSEKSKGE